MGILDWFRTKKPEPEPDYIPKERMAEASGEEISQKVHKLSSTLGGVHYRTTELIQKCEEGEEEYKRTAIEAQLKHQDIKFKSREEYRELQKAYKEAKNTLKRSITLMERSLAHNTRSIEDIDDYIKDKEITKLDGAYRYLGRFALDVNRAKIQILRAAAFITEAKKRDKTQFTIDTLTDFQVVIGAIELVIKTTNNLQAAIKVFKETSQGPAGKLERFA